MRQTEREEERRVLQRHGKKELELGTGDKGTVRETGSETSANRVDTKEEKAEDQMPLRKKRQQG